jgi:thiamine-monophosphate kinase
VTPTGRSRRRPAPALSERSFHTWIARTLPWGRAKVLPLGDDAAALAAPPGSSVVVSTDTLVAGTHFLPQSPPGLLGRAAVAVGLSDLASKGARPAGAVLALVVPIGTPETWARAVVLGAEAMASRFGAHLIGGDTKPGPVTTLVGTVFGWGRGDELVPRSGARVGDLVVTTGTVGAGGAASIGLARAGRARAQAVRRMLEVEPRVREGLRLARYASAMLDTSDGIADAARLLAGASHRRIVLEEEKLPWHPRLRSLPPARRRALGFYGGDYELLATVPPRRLAAAQRALDGLGTPLSVVGTVERGRGAFLRHGADRSRMPPGGWRPFGAPVSPPKRRAP